MGMAETAQRVGFAPITRIDAGTREIEVTATSEAVDAYGTIFDYAASKAAFAQWLGNVREMHESVAVGRRVGVEYDDDARQVRVRLRISRGAESTWQKILDGTLCGASIGAANVNWEARRAAGGGEAVQVATAYELVELSLVDNPANPDCIGIALVRGRVPDVALLDEVGEDEGDASTEDTEAFTEKQGSGMRGPDAKGDAGEEGREERTERGMTRDEARNDAEYRAMADGRDGGLSPMEMRGVMAAARQAAAGMALLRGEMARAARAQHAALADLRVRVERMERQPEPGGPVLRAAEKVLGAPMGANGMNVAERISALQEFGAARTDQRAQVDLAAEILRLQRGQG